MSEPDDVKVRIRRLTANEVGGLRKGAATRMAALEQRWKKSQYTDTQALLGALYFCRPQLPAWLFNGLCQRMENQPQDAPSHHRTRWFMVMQELAFDPKLKVRDACKLASAKLEHTPARGGTSTMERSYYIIEPRERARRKRRQPKPKPKG